MWAAPLTLPHTSRLWVTELIIRVAKGCARLAELERSITLWSILASEAEEAACEADGSKT